jgi:hypothetical protein
MPLAGVGTMITSRTRKPGVIELLSAFSQSEK